MRNNDDNLECPLIRSYRTDVPLRLGLAATPSDVRERRLAEYSHLLWCCDALSLQLCRGELLPRAGSIQQAQFVSGTTLAVDPWPFSIERISAMVPARRVRSQSFASEAEFHVAYQAAEQQELQLNLAPMSRI
jgi:hypothetical protein